MIFYSSWMFVVQIFSEYQDSLKHHPGLSLKQTVLSGLTALTSVVQRNAKLSKFASEFAEISSGFDSYESSRSLSWPGRLVKPGEGSDKTEGDHVFLSDRAIFARIVQVSRGSELLLPVLR